MLRKGFFGMMAVLAAVMLVVGLAGCGDGAGNGGNGGDDYSVSYTGYKGTEKYILTITDQNAGRAVYSPKQWDKYELKLNDGAKKSIGIVYSIAGGNIGLQPDNGPVFYATVSGNNMTNLSYTITWDDNTTSAAPGALTATSQSGGGDQPGTEIAAKYRGVYEGDDDYAVNKNGGSVRDGTLTLTEDKIIFNAYPAGTNEAMFEKVSTGPDHVVTYFVHIGTWAYLFSDTAKIGIVWIDAEGDRIFATGVGAVDWAAGHNMMPYGSTYPVDLSDMPASTKSLGGQDWN